MAALTKVDLIAWFNYIAWTFDPRLLGKGKSTRIPFILYYFQIVFARAIRDAIIHGHDLIIEKSRDMGMTWLVLCVILHFWLYQRGFQALLCSRKEEYVDKPGDLKTLFEKLRWELRQIEAATPGLVPANWDKRQHCSERKLVNPANWSVISGEATTSDLGRSGRFNVIVIDEAAFVDKRIQTGMVSSVPDASPCVIWLSSPNGMADLFAYMARNARKSKHIINPYEVAEKECRQILMP